MDLELTSDQVALEEAVGKALARHDGDALLGELDAAGYLDVVRDAGPIEGVLVVERRPRRWPSVRSQRASSSARWRVCRTFLPQSAWSPAGPPRCAGGHRNAMRSSCSTATAPSSLRVATST
jgi:hypothetical protein